jgi:hypothetical protein
MLVGSRTVRKYWRLVNSSVSGDMWCSTFGIRYYRALLNLILIACLALLSITHGVNCLIYTLILTARSRNNKNISLTVLLSEDLVVIRAPVWKLVGRALVGIRTRYSEVLWANREIGVLSEWRSLSEISPPSFSESLATQARACNIEEKPLLCYECIMIDKSQPKFATDVLASWDIPIYLPWSFCQLEFQGITMISESRILPSPVLLSDPSNN